MTIIHTTTVSRCRTKVESDESTAHRQGITRTLGLKPRALVTRTPKRVDYQRPNKKYWFLQKILITITSLFQVVSGVCYVYYFWPSPLSKNVFGVSLISVTFFISLIILVYCYGRIVWVLTRRIDSKLSSSGSKDTFHLARTNTIKTLLLVSLCFVICWSNSQIYYLMYNLGYQVDWNSTYYNFTVFMVFVNCTVNPFIYLIKYKDYQEALRQCCSSKRFNSQKHAQ